MAKIREASPPPPAAVDMPEELLISILSRVPVEPLLRFNSVSKSWYSIISKNPNFIRLHLNFALNNPLNHASFVAHIYKRKTPTLSFKHKFTPLHLNNNNNNNVDVNNNNNNYDNAIDLGLPFRRGDLPRLPRNARMVLCGSCNGILCVSVGGFNREEFTFLWNPATKYSMLLPESVIKDYRNRNADNLSIGFGLEPVACDYKVVRILDFGIEGICGEVYSTNECVWREVRCVKAFLEYGSCDVCVKGVLYWVLRDEDGLLTFDLRSEVFGLHRFPRDVSEAIGGGYDARVTDFGDSVALIVCSLGKDCSSSVIGLWAFCDVCLDGNGSGNVVLGSWTRKFTFEVDRVVRFVYAYLMTGYFLMKDVEGVFLLYNLDKKETQNLSHLSHTCEIVGYTASLVSFVGSETVQWKPTYSIKG